MSSRVKFTAAQRKKVTTFPHYHTTLFVSVLRCARKHVDHPGSHSYRGRQGKMLGPDCFVKQENGASFMCLVGSETECDETSEWRDRSHLVAFSLSARSWQPTSNFGTTSCIISQLQYNTSNHRTIIEWMIDTSPRDFLLFSHHHSSVGASNSQEF